MYFFASPSDSSLKRGCEWLVLYPLSGALVTHCRLKINPVKTVCLCKHGLFIQVVCVLYFTESMVSIRSVNCEETLCYYLFCTV